MTNVIWDSSTASGVSISSNTATGTGSGWNTVDSEQRTSLEGSVEWTMAGQYALTGFTLTTSDTMGDTSFALYLNNGSFEAFTNGTGESISGSYSTSDTFKLAISSSGVVTALQNGSLLHTFSGTAAGNYYIHASLWAGSSVTSTIDIQNVSDVVEDTPDNTDGSTPLEHILYLNTRVPK